MIINRSCIAIAAMVLLFAVTASADKLTTDPNAAPKAEAAVVMPKDARLDQPVTYQKGYARLHTILDDLTAQTGVTIRAGSSPKDWQARDIPMVVCVKDMPLGKLLKAIADASHCALRSFTPEDGDKATMYRIYRPEHIKDAMIAAIKTSRDVEVAMLRWNWDAVIKLSKMPDADVWKDDKSELIARGKLFAAIGNEARERLLAGDVLKLDGSSVPQALDWFKACYGHLAYFPDATEPPQGTWAKATSVTLTAYLRNPDTDSKPEIFFMTRAKIGDSAEDYVYVMSSAQEMNPKALALPPLPSVPRDKSSDPGPDYHPFRSVEDSGMPVLATKVKPIAPDKAEVVTFADKVVVLSKVGGVNIVCEDFQSQLEWRSIPAAAFYGRETVLVHWLWESGYGEWFSDAKNNLILGWVHEWRQSHVNLVSEAYLADLHKKLHGEGVELDDALSVRSLTTRQRGDWITGSRDLKRLRDIQFTEESSPLWDMYSALPEQDKALAKSEAGLCLGKFDPAWLVGFFKESHRKMINRDGLSPSVGSPFPMFPQELLDAQRVGDYTIRISREESPVWSTPRESLSARTRRYKYKMEFRKSGGDKPIMTFIESTEYPIIEMEASRPNAK